MCGINQLIIDQKNRDFFATRTELKASECAGTPMREPRKGILNAIDKSVAGPLFPDTTN